MQYKFNEDIFTSTTDAIVNSVNCVGVMGKGIALEFKKRFPQMYEDYRSKCLRHTVQIGKLDVYLEYTPVIINFPTKRHWKEKSSLEYIEQVLVASAEPRI